MLTVTGDGGVVVGDGAGGFPAAAGGDDATVAPVDIDRCRNWAESGQRLEGRMSNHWCYGGDGSVGVEAVGRQKAVALMAAESATLEATGTAPCVQVFVLVLSRGRSGPGREILIFVHRRKTVPGDLVEGKKVAWGHAFMIQQVRREVGGVGARGE